MCLGGSRLPAAVLTLGGDLGGEVPRGRCRSLPRTVDADHPGAPAKTEAVDARPSR